MIKVNFAYSISKSIILSMTPHSPPMIIIRNSPSTGMRYIRCFTACLLLVASLIVTAAAAAGTDAQAAQTLITTTADRMLSALKSEDKTLRDNPQRVHELVDKNLLPHIDFEYMSRIVLAKSWPSATADQRIRFIKEFRQFLIRFYTAALIEYTKGHDIPKDLMQFLPLRTVPGENKVTVRSEIRQPESAQAIPVSYQLYLSGNQWKVYDVNVDGISMVVNYRSNFKREIRKAGLDGLIARLAKRNEELATR